MNAFLKYGLQANAYAFAYSKQEDYSQRTIGDHLGIFALGGLTGTVVDGFFTNNKSWENTIFNNSLKSVIGGTAFSLEYVIGGKIKAIDKDFKNDPNKVTIYSGKWFEQTLFNF